MNEIWKECPVNNNYAVSNMGRIKRLTKSNSAPAQHILTPGRRRGYQSMKLYSKGKFITYTVHGLVMLTFVGQRPKNFHINHKDTNKLNNCLYNLEYCTVRENFAHAKQNGLTGKGERNNKAKMTERDVKKCRKLHAAKIATPSALARTYGVHPTTIQNIVSFRTWAHIR